LLVEIGQGTFKHLAVPQMGSAAELLENTQPGESEPFDLLKQVRFLRSDLGPGRQFLLAGLRLLLLDRLAFPAPSHSSDYTNADRLAKPGNAPMEQGNSRMALPFDVLKRTGLIAQHSLRLFFLCKHIAKEL